MREEGTMRAYLVFTETGPILIMTSCPHITEQPLVDALNRRGVDKFIAYEVSIEEVHRLYGVPFEVVAADLEQRKDMRVLDFNGPHLIDTFPLSDLGAPIAYEH
jgi:hypothetical protein